MQKSVTKRQKTSGGLGNLYVDNWENKGIIETDILCLVSRHLQGLDWGLAGHRKWNQYNKLNFR